VQEELPLKPINRGIIWREKEQREREREYSRIKERGVAAITEETQTLLSTNQKSFFLPSLGVVFQ
jgi:hypothetical protein